MYNQAKIIGAPVSVKPLGLKYPLSKITLPAKPTKSTAKADALVTTKLYIPRLRPDLAPRPHLIARLNEAYSHKLTLLSTPAGFGKTTLLAEWVRQCNTPVAWLSLDKEDNEPQRFWTYVIAALQRLRPGLGEDTLTCLECPERPALEAILTLFINEIAAQPAESPYLLVLDDYHLIEAPVIHEGLSFLLEHLPDNLHLVIATRAEPPLPLARLRLGNELLEIRAEALRFSLEEVATFFKQTVELELTNDEVAALAERTEGWVAALQAAALSLREQADVASFISTFSGSHRYIMDYLVDEVLRQQPEPIQTFLLQTAILERVSGPLSEAITGQAHGQAILEGLEAANLFIVPLDDERRWYRYHHLFAEALRHRLAQLQPQNVPEYHQRASAWFEQRGLAAEAMHHALASRDFERAAALFPERSQAKNGKSKAGKAYPKTQPSSLRLQPLVEPLTERELEVLQLLAAGLNNRAMGEELIISVGTVKRHITNIYGKLGVANRVEAVTKARALNVLQP
jgi:LuxR family maltose regulon positive regulatory protein